MSKPPIQNSTEPSGGSGFNLSSLNLGNGLLEIAALTSLLGSTAADSLALGNKGPAGLAWAMMTVFGATSVVKLFIATAMPGWLREIVGVRSPKSDAVVGLSLDLNRDFKSRHRAEHAIAVECETNVNAPGRKTRDLAADVKSRDVYVFDQRTTNILRSIPASSPGDDLEIYSFVQDAWGRQNAKHHSYIDWISLFLSGIAKLIECLVLWRYGALLLVWIAFSTWLYFFSAALILRLHGLLRRGQDLEIDTITGTLPTSSTAGGPRKVLLGITKSPRLHIIWRIIWGIGSFIGIASVVATYLALGHSSSNTVFFAWAGFQILWVSVRSAVFYYVSDIEGQYHVGLKGKPWSKVNPQERERVRRLVFALSKYQIYHHPRSPLSYIQDMNSVEKLENVQAEYPLPPDSKTVSVSVQDVIPDTVLSSLSWVFGSKKGGFDLYDTSIIVFNTPNGPVSVPAARSLSSQSSLNEELDAETGSGDTHLPRGGLVPQGNSTSAWVRKIDVQWRYWIPCSGGRWLFFTTEQTKSKGPSTAEVLSDQQVTDLLDSGSIYISLRHVDEVKEIVQSSTDACGYLQELLK